MDNEEPQTTPIANLEIEHTGHKLPEQSRIPLCPIPRSTTIQDIIHQWQPMGIRVTLNLPFTGNDQDYLFVIRNGPFIPRVDYGYTDFTGITNPNIPSPAEIVDFAFNNMANVRQGTIQAQYQDPSKNPIYITNYDYPPPLAALSTMFRRWRGTMHYRVRMVAGFTTQGYIFSSLVRNIRDPITLRNRFWTTPAFRMEDASYKSAMLNSYVMGDTAMFRHFEVQVPFEYPVPYYDQFNWIANRTRPAQYFQTELDIPAGSSPNGNFPIKQSNVLAANYNEPHGDNYIVFGLRGKLESSVQNSQISFEIEYRAGDDFQFADPFLPFYPFYLAPRGKAPWYRGQTIPSNDYGSNGITRCWSKTQAAEIITPKVEESLPEQILKSDDPTDTAFEEGEWKWDEKQKKYVRKKKRVSSRQTRDLTDLDSDSGEDTVDESRQRPLRKSLRNLLVS